MTPKFNDIFSQKKNNEKPEIKEKIIIDYREKNSLVVSELVKLGFEIEFKELKVADYLLKDIAIERKTVSDFISSMINKRLFKQLEELQQYENRLLIIEGIEEQDLYNEENSGVNSNAVRGFLLSILLKFKTPIIFSKDYKDTARFILVLSRKKIKEEFSFKAKKKSFSVKEQMQMIIEGFPGIGPKNAKKLLQEFKSIKNIINASEEELKKIIGIKAESVKKIIEELF